MLPVPTVSQKEAWFERFQQSLGEPLGISPKALAGKLKATSFSDLEEFCADVRRRQVLALPNSNVKRIVGERLKQWQRRFAARE